nr:MerR family DNA-binding transcriptional regulator [Alteromonas mediterranea]
MAPEPLVSIGFIAKRTGNAVSLIRYYANEGLIPFVRTGGGNRAFPRSVIRRVSFYSNSAKHGVLPCANKKFVVYAT